MDFFFPNLIYARIIFVKVPFSDCYENKQRHLKTQSDFLQRVFGLKTNLEKDEENIKKFLKPRNHLNHVEVTTQLNFPQLPLKGQLTQETLKILALRPSNSLP
ncbi:hypothetical protein CDAR_574361 [Caerostris darwini]|uniref:Uncharacterized protein n=1 Tax=Caerostris darwini TaxID=1538125 RepID=A0AAV4NQM6_9ARAC|nr:hypothetical protein CDAR_574361 [Caerostris darwini]